MYSGFAIGGKARAGKNVLAERLGQIMVDQGYWPTCLAFSTPLKEMVAQEIGHTKKHAGARDEMIRIGDRERGRDPDVFVKLMSHEVDRVCLFGGSPIITDVRRANEFDWCVNAGFFTVFVDAPVEDRVARLREMGEPVGIASSPHPTESEAYTFPWHTRVFNRHSVNPSAVADENARIILAAAGWL